MNLANIVIILSNLSENQNVRASSSLLRCGRYFGNDDDSSGHKWHVWAE